MLIVSQPAVADVSMSSFVSDNHRYSTFNAEHRVILLSNDMMAQQGGRDALVNANCLVTLTPSVEEAIAIAHDDECDIIVVDFRPDILGYQAVCRLRAAGVELPILFISARSSADAHERALDAGADDVIVMPLDEVELKTHIVALSNIAMISRAPHFPRVGSLCLDMIQRRILVDDEALALTRSEYAVLELLMSRNGDPTARAQIEASVAAAGDPSPKRHLDALIARLRGKLDAAGVNDTIGVVRGFGYALHHASAMPVRP
jgi:DNA-binding response OmpR family regulator